MNIAHPQNNSIAVSNVKAVSTPVFGEELNAFLKQYGRLNFRECQKEIKALLGITAASTAYDLKVNPAGRGVFLRAAGLPDRAFYRNRSFQDWTVADRKKIINSSQRLNEWSGGICLDGDAE